MLYHALYQHSVLQRHIIDPCQSCVAIHGLLNVMLPGTHVLWSWRRNLRNSLALYVFKRCPMKTNGSQSDFGMNLELTVSFPAERPLKILGAHGVPKSPGAVAEAHRVSREGAVRCFYFGWHSGWWFGTL